MQPVGCLWCHVGCGSVCPPAKHLSVSVELLRSWRYFNSLSELCVPSHVSVLSQALLKTAGKEMKEGTVSSSAPGGRGEQQEPAAVSQQLAKVMPALQRRGTPAVTAVSAQLPSAGDMCCPPFCKGHCWGWRLHLAGVWQRGKTGLAVRREFQNSTTIDFTEKEKKNEEKWKYLWFIVVGSLLLASSGAQWEIRTFCYHFLPQNEKVAQSASDVVASQQQVAPSVLIYNWWEEAERWEEALIFYYPSSLINPI